MGNPLFSIIIPTYNSSKYINDTIKSVENQTFSSYELIFVDDASSDCTFEVLEKWSKKVREDVVLIRNERNQGPGIARNIGIQYSKGKYILFLDSDDMLDANLLEKLSNQIETSGDFDVCDFDFRWKESANECQGERKDMQFLGMDRVEYLQKILKLHTDAQVILTCYRKQFLIDNNIYFKEGFHEDVAFFYKANHYAKKYCFINYVGYIKMNRPDSIVNTCSKKHIDGFFNAWKDIELVLSNEDTLYASWKVGIIAIAAVKIRDILFSDLKNDTKKELYRLIVEYVKYMCSEDDWKKKFQTRYYRMVNILLDFDEKEYFNVVELERELMKIMKKAWSCWDIQNSLFLADDEFRVCCKRFFLNGEKKGDVVLTKVDRQMNGTQMVDIVINKKKELKKRINMGEATECDGCPYLLYDYWDDKFHMRKLSFEYHSLCNLRCVYCSEKYYGGRKPSYNIAEFINEMLDRGLLSKCESVVWGGGEPTLEKNFIPMLCKMTSSEISANQNVITNSTRYLPEISKLLKEDKINIITSIDSGTNDTYKNVRGKDYFENVFENLKKYAKMNSSNIIIKYIILKENCKYEEIKSFVSYIKIYGLEKCNFQISCNFNQESISFEEKLGAVILYALLKEQGVKIIYFDELLRERIHVRKTEFDEMKKIFLEKGIQNIFLEEKRENIVIWGSDNQIRSLIDDTLYFSGCKPMGLIAGHSSYIGKKYKDFTYCSVDEYITKDVFIVIAAVQGTRRIYEEFVKQGFPEERLIEKLIL